jgi:hypothetical protein
MKFAMWRLRPYKNISDSITRKVKENTNMKFMKEVLGEEFNRNLLL